MFLLSSGQYLLVPIVYTKETLVSTWVFRDFRREFVLLGYLLPVPMLVHLDSEAADKDLLVEWSLEAWSTWFRRSSSSVELVRVGGRASKGSNEMQISSRPMVQERSLASVGRLRVVLRR
jgi:hypothetical protein